MKVRVLFIALIMSCLLSVSPVFAYGGEPDTGSSGHALDSSASIDTRGGGSTGEFSTYALNADAIITTLNAETAGEFSGFTLGLEEAPRNGESIQALSSESLDAIWSTVGGVQYQTEAHKLLAFINAERAKVGAPALSWDSTLEEIAMERAAEITVVYASDHRRPNDNSCFEIYPKGVMVAENIAYGFGTADGVNAAWASSSGHYQNMVNPEFTSVGAACYIRDGVYYWVESFSGGSQTPPTSESIDESIDDPIDGPAAYGFFSNPLYINNVYHDVNHDDWFVTDKSLAFVSNYGIMNGYSDAYKYPNGFFGPYDGLTRGAVVTMLYRLAANGDRLYGSSGFLDVPDNEYYSEPIAWAVAVGIVKGYVDAFGNPTGYFGPDDYVTREQLVKMLGELQVELSGEPLRSDQIAASHLRGWDAVSLWAQPYVSWAVDVGLLGNGDSSYDINPRGVAQRAQAAKMVRLFASL